MKFLEFVFVTFIVFTLVLASMFLLTAIFKASCVINTGYECRKQRIEHCIADEIFNRGECILIIGND